MPLESKYYKFYLQYKSYSLIMLSETGWIYEMQTQGRFYGSPVTICEYEQVASCTSIQEGEMDQWKYGHSW